VSEGSIVKRDGELKSGAGRRKKGGFHEGRSRADGGGWRMRKEGDRRRDGLDLDYVGLEKTSWGGGGARGTGGSKRETFVGQIIQERRKPDSPGRGGFRGKKRCVLRKGGIRC